MFFKIQNVIKTYLFLGLGSGGDGGYLDVNTFVLHLGSI